jgi:hypothetical protein
MKNKQKNNQGWKSELRRRQAPPSLNKKGIFLFIALFLEMIENPIDLYVLTRSTIYRFIWYILLALLFCKTKKYSELATQSGPEFL